MAVRNDNPLIGGVDWLTGDCALSDDFNDTFDAFYDLYNKTNWD